MKNLLAPDVLGAAEVPVVKSLYGKNISSVPLFCAKETKGTQINQSINFKQNKWYFIERIKALN